MSADTIEELPDSEEPKKSSGGSSVVQMVVVILVICVINFAVAYFVLIPSLAPSGAGDEDQGNTHSAHAKEDVNAHAKLHQYPFEPVTTNLHSPYKSRLIKLQFTVAGKHPQFEQVCEENLAKLKDKTNGVLQSLTLLDTQDPGVRNTIKTRLINDFENALGERIIEEIYITDMVIQ